MVFPHVMHAQRADHVTSWVCGRIWVTCLLRFCTHYLSCDACCRDLTFGGMHANHLNQLISSAHNIHCNIRHGTNL